jgi:hypothetical protein
MPMGGEMPTDPAGMGQVGPPAAPSDPHVPNAFHYPQEPVHEHHAAPERPPQDPAGIRPPPPAVGPGGPPVGGERPPEPAAAPEQPPMQPA